MNSEYEIDIERPIHSRRGDHKLVVVATDPQGQEVYRHRVDLNDEKADQGCRKFGHHNWQHR